jgi:hypothetical protein
VSAVEGSRYIVQEVETFSANIPATTDEIVDRWDCSDYKVAIDLETEADLYRRFSTEKFDRGNKAGDRRAREQRAEPSPEQIFAAEAAKNAKK